ncbi:hypothetical protein CIK05_04460 [Bdellovibrio sp. qaytius]|nr:hypothetical protein CIK05_04460 [Bdellovibrio sp. qaytius]
METDRLRYFCLIAETGSLTKAAEILNVSHSGLSKAMSLLQEELGQSLFRPQGRGLEITEQGKKLYQRSKEVLTLVDNLKAESKPVEKPALRIGMTEVLSSAFASEITASFEGGLSIYDLDSGEIEVKILADQIEFGVTGVPFPHQQLDYLKIAKVSMGIFFVNTQFQKMNIEEIPFVGPNSEINNNPLSIKARDGWPENKTRNLVYGAGTLAIALEIVDSGKAALYMPQFVAQALNKKRSKQFQLLEHEASQALIKSAARDVYLVKKKNAEESKTMKMVARILRKGS